MLLAFLNLGLGGVSLSAVDLVLEIRSRAVDGGLLGEEVLSESSLGDEGASGIGEEVREEAVDLWSEL